MKDFIMTPAGQKARREISDRLFEIADVRKKISVLPSKLAKKSGRAAYARILAQAPK